MILLLQKINSIFALLVIAFAVPSFAFAQNAISFSVSPTIFDMTANPGQTWVSSVRVINANPYDLTVYMDVVNFKPQGETGVPSFIPQEDGANPASNFAGWIQTDSEITIPAEKTIELPLKIVVPENAEPGGHFAAILIGTKPPQKTSDISQVETSQIISTLLFLRVSGDINEQASIRSFRSTNYIVSTPETKLELRIENKGNVHVQPQGQIKIYNMWGQERGVIPVNQQTLFGNVLSQSVRKYSFDWKGDWAISDIGRYTAEVALTYGLDSKQSAYAKTAFWIIPWKIILLFLTIIVAFGYMFTWAIKAYIRRMLLIAGVPTQSPVNNSTPITKTKKLSVAAPIEAGMLDLRTRLGHTDSLKNYFAESFIFIKSYWKFFTSLLALLVFVTLVVLFFTSVFTPSRYYEVTTDSGKTVTSDEIEQQSSAPAEEINVEVPQASLGDPVVKIVNRSGESALSEKIEALLNSKDYQIDETSIDETTIEQRTVIVFSPSQTEKALKLSSMLNNAPLSALTSESSDVTPEITIYIGSDLSSLVQ